MCANRRKFFKEIFCFFAISFVSFFAFSGGGQSKPKREAEKNSDEKLVKLKELADKISKEDINIMMGCSSNSKFGTGCHNISAKDFGKLGLSKDCLSCISILKTLLLDELYHGKICLKEDKLGALISFFHRSVCNFYFNSHCRDGLWPQSDDGKLLKRECESFFCMPVVSCLCKRYEIKVAKGSQMSGYCEISDKEFNFSSDTILFKDNEPYVEITYFMPFPSIGKIGKLQYKENNVARSFFVENDEENSYQTIELLASAEEAGQQLEIFGQDNSLSVSPPNKIMLLWKDKSSFVGNENSFEFSLKNGSSIGRKHLVICDTIKLRNGGYVKILSKIYFYPSEYLALEAFDKFSEEKLKQQDDFFKAFLKLCEERLNEISEEFNEDQIVAINKKILQVKNEYEDRHILPFNFITEPEKFIRSLISKNDKSETSVPQEAISLIEWAKELGETEEASLRAGEEEAQLRKQEELRIAKERAEQERLAEEQARIEAERQAAKLKAKQEAEARRKAEEEAQRLKQELEDARKLEAERKAAEEERLAEEQARIEAERQAAKLKAKQEAEARRKAEEEAQRLKQELEDARKLEAERKAAEEKRLAEEQARIEAERQAAKLKAKQEAEARKPEELKHQKVAEQEKSKKGITGQEFLTYVNAHGTPHKKNFMSRLLKSKKLELDKIYTAEDNFPSQVNSLFENALNEKGK